MILTGVNEVICCLINKHRTQNNMYGNVLAWLPFLLSAVRGVEWKDSDPFRFFIPGKM
jgi:hypothetical protein